MVARKSLMSVILLQTGAGAENSGRIVNKFWKIRDGVVPAKSTVTQTQT
jgi:hypothetical protein